MTAQLTYLLSQTVVCGVYLVPEDPQRAGDDDRSGDDNIDDELSADDRVLGLARRLLQDIVVDRFNTKTTRQQYHIDRVLNGRPVQHQDYTSTISPRQSP